MNAIETRFAAACFFLALAWSAAARGVKIPGNAVVMVFRNDLAVRLLAASVPAGIEAPLRLYLTENRDGTASLNYRTPSATFAPFRNPEVDRLARCLPRSLVAWRWATVRASPSAATSAHFSPGSRARACTAGFGSRRRCPGAGPD